MAAMLNTDEDLPEEGVTPFDSWPELVAGAPKTVSKKHKTELFLV